MYVCTLWCSVRCFPFVSIWARRKARLGIVFQVPKFFEITQPRISLYRCKCIMRTAFAHPFGNVRLLLSAAVAIRVHARVQFTRTRCTRLCMCYLYTCTKANVRSGDVIRSKIVLGSGVKYISLPLKKQISSIFNYSCSDFICPNLRIDFALKLLTVIL